MSRELRKLLYGSNVSGEFMPPIYFFCSSAENSGDLQVKLAWFQGLTKVRGKYGCQTNETYDLSVDLSNSGCIDKELMQKFIIKKYLPLYPTCKSVIVRKNIGKFICVPVILNTDSGQGHLTASFFSLEF